MTYSINDVAKQFNISAYTLRFYDKEGLFPFLSRNKTGNREFTESDLEWVRLVCCLKNTGMKIKEIKKYMDLCQEGEDTVEQRKNMYMNHRRCILQKIDDLKEDLNLIDAKIAFYENPEIAHILVPHQSKADISSQAVSHNQILSMSTKNSNMSTDKHSY